MNLDYGITSTFQRVIGQYGLAVALVAVVLLVLIFVAMRYALARIDGERAAQAASLARENASQVARDAAQGQLVRELEAARLQNLKIVENHLAHDRDEREAIARALAKADSRDEAVVAALNELAQSIREDRAASALERKTFHERLNAIHLDVRDRSRGGS